MRNKKLLIVEDDPAISTMLVDILDKSLDIHLASNFNEALNYLKSTKPDLVITDFNFPGGNGLEVALMAREMGCEEILLHSGDSILYENEPAFSSVAAKFQVDRILKFVKKKERQEIDALLNNASKNYYR
jgi:CheY-like chemotaxis protein